VVLVALVDKLMRSSDECEVVDVVELEITISKRESTSVEKVWYIPPS